MNYFFVGIGGIFGALCRYYIGTIVNEITPSVFPYGTLFVNLAGSFLLSFIAYSNLLRWNIQQRYILAINTGFIGSFTTFSTFSVEAFHLIDSLYYTLAFFYVLVSLAGGLILSCFGMYLASAVHKTEEEPAQTSR